MNENSLKRSWSWVIQQCPTQTSGEAAMPSLLKSSLQRGLRLCFRWYKSLFIQECGRSRILAIPFHAQNSHKAVNLVSNQFSSLEEGEPNPGMVKITIPMYSRIQVCCRLYRFLQWEYHIGNKSYLKLVFRKKKKKKKELVIPAISQEFLGPLGWTAEPCREQLSKHTWCETLTKHEQEIRATGRNTEKAHTAAIHMSLNSLPRPQSISNG